MTSLTAWFGMYGWLVEAALSLALTAAALFVWVRIQRFLSQRAKATAQVWDDIVLRAVSAPIVALILVLGAQQIIAAAGGIFANYQEISRVFSVVRSVAFAVAIFWALLRLTGGVEQHYRHNTLFIGGRQMDVGVTFGIFRGIRIIIFAIAALTVMDAFGVSITGILAFGGLGGVVFGFAAKDMLANFFSGMVIFWERPFVIGDWIRCPESNIEGVVEKIGWRVTQLRTFDQRPLYVPNAVFSNQVIENPQRMRNRRIYEYMGLRYEDIDKLPAVLEDIRTMLKVHEEIDQEQIQIVAFDCYGDSTLNFFIYAMTRTTMWVKFHAIKGDVLLHVAAIVKKHGAEFAFPTRTVHLATNTAASGANAPEE